MSFMFKYLFVFAIIFTPFSTVLDSLFWMILGERTEVITPTWIRLMDELFSVGIFLILVIRFLQDKFIIIRINNLYNMFIVLSMISIAYSILNNPVLITLSGLKWFMYIFLIGMFFYLKDEEKEFIYNKLVLILSIFLILNLILQLIQLISFAYYFSNTFFGLSQRTIGFFREPNTLALFNIITFYFIYNYMRNTFFKKIIIFCILPISIILTGSITVILTFALILILLNLRINFLYFIFIFLSLLLVLYVAAPYISFRPGLINSVLIRLDILINNVNIDNLMFSKIFGHGTSSAILLNISNKIPESTIASLLINLGVLATVIFYVMFFQLYKLEKGKILLVCVLSMGLTNCIFSAYPVNLLIAFELSCLLVLLKECKKC